MIVGAGANQSAFAVISGFHTEPLEVVSEPAAGQKHSNKAPPSPLLGGKKVPKQVVNSNSGFIIAFDLSVAIETIRKNPIGPLNPKK